MKIINKTLLDFLEKGCFKNNNFKDRKNYFESVEKTIYNCGMNRYIEELIFAIKNKLSKTHSSELLDINLDIGVVDSGIYLYLEDPNFQIYSFNSLKMDQRVSEVKENNESILKKAVAIMNSEIKQFEHNKQVFQSEINNLIKKERENGEFKCDYEFFDTTDKEKFSPIGSYNPFIFGRYYPKGSYLRASFLQMECSVRTEESRTLQDKFYTSEEAEEILKGTVEEFKFKFEKTISKNINYFIKALLRNKYGFTSEEFNKIVFIPANGGHVDYNLKDIDNKWKVKFINIPLDVKLSEIDKIVGFLKVINFIEKQSKEIQNVLRFFNFNGSELNFKNGLLSDNWSLECLENLVFEINDRIKESKHMLRHNIYQENFESFSYGKSFFFKKNKSFEYAGNLFERIDYRMPCSKKIRSIMYENGRAISANRFFRILRKSKKAKQ